ncbi:MAG: tetratricopeptide repeat protein [Actinobacteria bacterium]|nr:tetratricopeptide repeat protein [Actinomycetota bacterium]
MTESLTENPLPADVVAELEPFPAKVRALLGAAMMLLPEYPAEAQRYAEGAKKLAPRSAAVREAVGMAAYQSGDYAVAIKELRSAARISGDDNLYPLIADCERGLGRPEKALEIASRKLTLNRADRIEMRLVAAGARLDLDQAEEAMRILQGPMLDDEEPSESSARLKYVYAEALLAAGRPDEAREWFLRAAAADPDGLTDAVDRVAALDSQAAEGTQA